MARPRGVEPLTFWSVVKRSIQLSYGRCLCYSWWCWLDIHYGAAERTRTSTGLLLPAPQAGASTIPPRPHTAYSWHITMKLMERVKRIELSQSAWKAEVLPLNYTRLFEWSGRQDSNLRPPGPKPGALPSWATSRFFKMAVQTGIEPAISCVTGRHVNRYTTGPFEWWPVRDSNPCMHAWKACVLNRFTNGPYF